MAMEILAVICLLFLLLVIHHWRKHRNDAVLTNWPVFGVMPGLVKNIQRLHDFATEVLKSSGGTKAIQGPWFSNFDFWVTCDPTNMRHILNTNIANYPKGPEFQKMFEPFGYGITNSESHLWKNQRKMLLSIIGHSKFESYMEKTFERKVVHGLIPLLDHVSKSRIEVDFQDVFQRLTFDNISILVLGTDPLSLSIDFPNVAYKNAFDDVEEMIFRRHFKPETLWKLQRWLQIGGEKKLTKSLKVFDEFIYQSIATKRQELIKRSRIIENKDVEEANNIDDIVTSYMKQLKENQGQMLLGCYADSDKFLRDTSLNLMVAGRDTVASALTWFFWLVSTHPFVETKIVEEIREKLAEIHDKDSRFIITKEVINKLVYLHATLCETLRLYPPIPINQRASSNADTLPSGHHLKKNQRILLYFYSMGRMEEIWGEDCLEFKPERWVSYDGGERRLVYVPSYKFTAYNAGPQACVGKGMSFTEMKMVAANILWNYRVEMVEGHPVSPSLSIILYMKYGLKVMISPRCG